MFVDYSMPLENSKSPRTLIGSFFNEFFYYGNRRYQILTQINDTITLKEKIFPPQSNKKIALKVALLFTVIFPVIAAAYRVYEIVKLKSFKNIKIISSEEKRLSDKKNPIQNTSKDNKPDPQDNKPETLNQTSSSLPPQSSQTVPSSQSDSKSNFTNHSVQSSPQEETDKTELLNRCFLNLTKSSEDQDKSLEKFYGKKKSSDEYTSYHREIINFLRENGKYLTTLNLAQFYFKDALDYLKFCPNVKDLVLSNAKFNDYGIEQLAKLSLKKLEEFQLDSSNILSEKSNLTDESLTILSQSELMENICAFTISKTNLTDKSMKSFANSKYFKKLAFLNFRECKLNGDQIKTLCQSDNVKHLDTLLLDEIGVESVGAKALADAENLKSLKRLSLHRHQLQKEDIRYLSQSSNLKQLEYLNIETQYEKFSDIDKLEIKAMFSNFKELKRFFV